MLTDITIDTNVMLHAQNPDEQRSSESNTLLQNMLKSQTFLCVDEGFHVDELRNSSFIGKEYLDKLRIGSLGYAVVAKLGSEFRIKPLPRLAPRPQKKKINQLIRNKRDRIFLSVAFNSEDQKLVSHDYNDFQESKRLTIRTELSVDIIDANECLTHI